MSDYYVGIDLDGNVYLEHAFWKKHKYIRIENGRYIYAKDANDENGQKKIQYVKPTTSKEKTKVYKNNYEYAKEQKKSVDKDMKRAVKAANRNYAALKKAQDNYKPPKNKYNMTLAEKYQEKKIQKLNEKADESMKHRAELKKKRDRADSQVESTKRLYDEAKASVAAERKKRVDSFISKFTKEKTSSISNNKNYKKGWANR